MSYGKIGLQRIGVFTAVAGTGGFTAAANRLDLTKAVVSQQVRRLEKELGVELLVRTTRKVVMTDAGRRLYEQATPLLGELDQVLSGVREESDSLHGTLRVTATNDYLEQVLGEHLAAFGALHPQLRIELIAADRTLDLLAERIDVAFRVGWLRESSMHATRLAEFKPYVVASPSYLRSVGVPTHPQELARIDWLELTLLPTPLTLDFKGPSGQRSKVRVRSRYASNSPQALLSLARSGAGATAATDFAAAPDIASGKLVRLLPRWSLPRGGLYAVYAAIKKPPTKVRALVDFIKARNLDLPAAPQTRR